VVEFDHAIAVWNTTRLASLWCWGYNVYGQLGDGTQTTTDTPVLVQGL